MTSADKAAERAVKRRREEDEWEGLRAKWLSRLAWIAVVALALVASYAFRQERRASVAVLGLMTAGAAWLSGVLTGFLFGIPHARQGEGAGPVQLKTEVAEDAAEKSDDSRYRPSTSLEQIADWLTKIIVGVGLTQLNNIPRKLDALAAYVAFGMGNDPASKPFALAVIIYLSVSGFLFGFLWSRLYMLKAFAEAEILRRLREIKSELDFDNDAKALVSQHLASDEPPARRDSLTQSIAKATRAARSEIFDKAKEARRAPGAKDDVLLRAAEVFRALISNDTEDLDHESHAQLGYILNDLGKLEDALSELTRAIEIRTRRGKSGWSYYDFKRALVRIAGDTESRSKIDVREAILSDLRRVRRDPKLADEWEKEKNKSLIHDWLRKNGLDEGALNP